ncbi:Serine proteinase stubble [Nymphon striatum]|nr:Serine proteinase stubble [Nymphon striatum]
MGKKQKTLLSDKWVKSLWQLSSWDQLENVFGFPLSKLKMMRNFHKVCIVLAVVLQLINAAVWRWSADGSHTLSIWSTDQECRNQYKPSMFTVRAGSFFRSNNNDPLLEDFKVTKIILHPSYTYPNYYHDIAIMKLDRSITYKGSNVLPICLPPHESDYVGVNAIVAGWGWLDEDRNTGIGCARPQLPGLYTKVSHYRNWILENIDKPDSSSS